MSSVDRKSLAGLRLKAMGALVGFGAFVLLVWAISLLFAGFVPTPFLLLAGMLVVLALILWSWGACLCRKHSAG